jgi:hypothetical protein
MNSLLIPLVAAVNLPQLLISFLVLLVVIAVVGGLIYAIERWIIGGAIPTPFKLVIGIAMILLVVIWALNQFWPGSLG